jgi:tripartite-type tricarboxylate transporter receptor subunit TctC
VVAKLNGAINAALKAPAVVQRMHDYGMEAQPGTPQQFFDMARAEAKRWGRHQVGGRQARLTAAVRAAARAT